MSINPDKNSKLQKLYNEWKKEPTKEKAIELTKGLTKAEKMTLTQWFMRDNTKKPDLADKYLNEPEIQQNKPVKKESSIADYLVPIGSGAAMIGGAILACTGIASGLGIGLMALGAGVGLSSCNKEDFSNQVIIQGNNSETNVVATTNVNIEMDSLDELVTAINNQTEEMKKAFAQVLAAIATIGNKLDGLGIQASNLFNQIVTTLSGLLVATTDNSDKLNTIISLLTTLINKIDTIGENNSLYFQAILGKLDSLSDTQLEMLTRLINIDNLTEENNAVLELILHKLSTIENGNDENGQRLDAILSKLNEIATNQNTNNANIQSLLLQVLAKMDLGAANFDSRMKQIIDLIEQVANNQNENHADVQALLLQILAKMDDVDLKMTAILDLVGDLNSQQLDLTTITDLLREINGKITTAGEIQIIVQAALRSIVTTLDANHSELKAILERILGKTCNCQSGDCCADILEKLQEIIDALNDNNETPNEGVEDAEDLEEFFS